MIFLISAQGKPFGVSIPAGGLDKILHIAEYAVLGFILARAVAGPSKNITAAKLIFITFGISTLYGLSDEFHQYFIPCRVASVSDLLADAAGGFLGAVIFALFRKKNKAIINGYNFTF